MSVRLYLFFFLLSLLCSAQVNAENAFVVIRPSNESLLACARALADEALGRRGETKTVPVNPYLVEDNRILVQGIPSFVQEVSRPEELVFRQYSTPENVPKIIAEKLLKAGPTAFYVGSMIPTITPFGVISPQYEYYPDLSGVFMTDVDTVPRRVLVEPEKVDKTRLSFVEFRVLPGTPVLKVAPAVYLVVGPPGRGKFETETQVSRQPLTIPVEILSYAIDGVKTVTQPRKYLLDETVAKINKRAPDDQQRKILREDAIDGLSVLNLIGAIWDLRKELAFDTGSPGKMGGVDEHQVNVWTNFEDLRVSEEGLSAVEQRHRQVIDLAVLLHDIGKRAHIDELMFEEHHYNSRITAAILKKSGFGEREVNLMYALIDHDILGAYMQNKIDESQAVAQLEDQLSRQNILDRKIFFTIAKRLFLADVAAHVDLFLHYFERDGAIGLRDYPRSVRLKSAPRMRLEALEKAFSRL